MRLLSVPQVFENFRQNFLGPEVILGNGPGRATVPVVIGADGVEGRYNLLHRLEGKQALACRQGIAKARVLSDYGTTRCQIAGIALTEPTAAQAYILILGDRELTPGDPHV